MATDRDPRRLYGPATGRRFDIALAAIAAAIATVAFLRPWWNRHLGLSLDGYMPLYGHLILDRKIPYRDFFLHLPPLQPLAEAALESLFGRSIFAVRVAGALGRVALAVVSAAWLARRFRPATAAAAAFAGVCLVSSDDTEILDLYNQWSLLGAILSGWLASMALDRGGRSRLLWLSSGIAAAAAIWTKQTVGLGATVAVPLALLLLAVHERQERPLLLREGGWFALGWALPGMAIGGWLGWHGAWRLFLEDVFVGAAASKGPPSEMLLRPFLDPFRFTELVVPALIGLAVALVAFLAVRARVESHPSSRASRAALLLTLCALLAIVAAGFALPSQLNAANAEESADRLRLPVRAGVLLGLFGMVPFTVALGLTALRRQADAADRELLVLALVAAAAAATHALSFPSGGASALPSLALVLALCIDAPSRHRLLTPLRAIPIAACLLATLTAIGIRRVEPFNFAQWREQPPAKARLESELPELAGIRLSRSTRVAVDELVTLLRRATLPDDPLFTFPVYPLFNWLADRPPATFAILHWIDVTPDAVVANDLGRLLATPPPAVVWQWIPESLLALNEQYFRQGRRSEMRSMRDAVAKLLEREYVLMLKAGAGSPSLPQLELWLRRDRASALERATAPGSEPFQAVPNRPLQGEAHG